MYMMTSQILRIVLLQIYRNLNVLEMDIFKCHWTVIAKYHVMGKNLKKVKILKLSRKTF